MSDRTRARHERAVSVKQRIRDRSEVVVGMFCALMSPNLVEQVAARNPLDFILVDFEHGPYFYERAVEMARAAEAYDVVPYARVSSPDSAVIQKLLDTGYKGIFVPQITTADEVEGVVAATRYAPVGTRGMNNSVRGVDYVPFSGWTPARVREIDDSILVGVLPLENKQAIDALDEIMAVPGIDAATMSFGDVTHALGRIGEWDHPEIRALQDRLAQICARQGVALVRSLGHSGAEARRAYDLGCRTFMLVDHAAADWGVRELFSHVTALGR